MTKCRNCGQTIVKAILPPPYDAWLHTDGFYGCWQGDAKVSKAEPDEGVEG